MGPPPGDSLRVSSAGPACPRPFAFVPVAPRVHTVEHFTEQCLVQLDLSWFVALLHSLPHSWQLHLKKKKRLRRAEVRCREGLWSVRCVVTHWDTGGKFLFIFLKSHSNLFGFQKKKISFFLSECFKTQVLL